jgi:hypothetical protein
MKLYPRRAMAELRPIPCLEAQFFPRSPRRISLELYGVSPPPAGGPAPRRSQASSTGSKRTAPQWQLPLCFFVALIFVAAFSVLRAMTGSAGSL